MTLPLSRSTQRTDNSCPSLLAVVSQTSLPRITGEDQARPGVGVFHFTFFSSLQVSGKPLAVEMPFPVGPRNCGHSANKDVARPNAKKPVNSFDCMGKSGRSQIKI